MNINKTFSSWRELDGVPYGSVLEPIFSYYIFNFFFLSKIDLCNFTNDTTPFV